MLYIYIHHDIFYFGLSLLCAHAVQDDHLEITPVSISHVYLLILVVYFEVSSHQLLVLGLCRFFFNFLVILKN